jgi:exopolysaccharide biosynthesis polyprenyl glycosylphosphotransferase
MAVDIVTWLLMLLAPGPRALHLVMVAALAVARPTLRLYRPRLRISWLEDLPRSLAAWALASSAAVLAAALTGFTRADVQDYLVFVALAVVASETARMLGMAMARRTRRQRSRGSRTLVMGAGKVGRALTDTMIAHPELGLSPVGFLDADPHGGPLQVPLLASDTADLASVIIEHQIDVVVVSFALTREAALVDTVITAHQLDCAVLVVPRLFELHHDGPDVERLRGYPLVRLRPDPTTRLSWWVKRSFDLIFAGMALLLLSPVIALAALAVLLESGRPIFFHQTRIGLDGLPFRLHKLRSLRPDSEEESQTTWNIARDKRVGPVGRLLRRTSLDELPQLWNIVRGEMSFVGPRPERPGYVELFSIEHERYWARHRVPAGLTGLSQISGLRGDTSISERARYDNYYIANWSLWLDFRILLLTAREVVRGSGG